MVTEVKLGDIAIFIGYRKLEEGFSPLLTAGDKIKITSIEVDDYDNTVYAAQPVLPDGSIDSDVTHGDQVYADEFELYIEPKVAKKSTGKKKKDNSAVSTEEEKLVPADLQNPDDAASDDDLDNDSMSDIPVDFTHDTVILEMIRKTNDLAALAQDVNTQGARLDFELGGLLVEIHRRKLHLSAGYADDSNGFASYVSATIGLERRKYYGLMNIYINFRKVGVTSENLAGVGWTKALIVARAKEDEILDWLDKARSMSRRDLEDGIKESKKKLGSPDRMKWSFTEYAESALLCDQAIEHAKDEVGGDDKNKAFEHICTIYLQLHANTTE